MFDSMHSKSGSYGLLVYLFYNCDFSTAPCIDIENRFISCELNCHPAKGWKPHRFFKLVNSIFFNCTFFYFY